MTTLLRSLRSPQGKVKFYRSNKCNQSLPLKKFRSSQIRNHAVAFTPSCSAWTSKPQEPSPSKISKNPEKINRKTKIRTAAQKIKKATKSPIKAVMRSLLRTRMLLTTSSTASRLLTTSQASSWARVRIACATWRAWVSSKTSCRART